MRGLEVKRNQAVAEDNRLRHLEYMLEEQCRQLRLQTQGLKANTEEAKQKVQKLQQTSEKLKTEKPSQIVDSLVISDGSTAIERSKNTTTFDPSKVNHDSDVHRVDDIHNSSSKRKVIVTNPNKGLSTAGWIGLAVAVPATCYFLFSTISKEKR